MIYKGLCQKKTVTVITAGGENQSCTAKLKSHNYIFLICQDEAGSSKIHEAARKKKQERTCDSSRLLTSLDVSSVSIAQRVFLMLKKKKSVEQKYVVLIANIIISCHQN